jgi:hypothetical protein
MKTIEKQKAAREERLKDLLAEDKKDDGLVFDQLGCDHLFTDESHYFNESCSDYSYVGQSLRDHNNSISKPNAWHRRRKLSGLEPGLTSRNPGGAPGSM